MRKEVVIENIETARDIARNQFGDASPELVLSIAGLLAADSIKEEIAEVVGCLLHPLEITPLP